MHHTDLPFHAVGRPSVTLLLQDLIALLVEHRPRVYLRPCGIYRQSVREKRFVRSARSLGT